MARYPKESRIGHDHHHQGSGRQSSRRKKTSLYARISGSRDRGSRSDDRRAVGVIHCLVVTPRPSPMTVGAVKGEYRKGDRLLCEVLERWLEPFRGAWRAESLLTLSLHRCTIRTIRTNSTVEGELTHGASTCQ